MNDPKIKFEYVNDEGDEIEVGLPAKYEVCWRCQGKGMHVNPNIDGHGISAEEWQDYWSLDEQDEYRNGGYDITCLECNGQRVIAELDRSKCDAELLKIYDRHAASNASYHRECEMERKYGA